MLLAASTWPSSASGAGAWKATIVLRSRSVVRSPDLRLADVAEVTGQDSDLVQRLSSLPLGSVRAEREWSLEEMSSLIRRAAGDEAGIEIRGAGGVRVSPATRPLREEELADLVRSYLSEVTPWNAEEITIRAVGCPAGTGIPKGEAALRVAGRSVPSSFSDMLLPVEITWGGRPFQTFWLKACAVVQAGVVRVTRRIPYRSVLDGQSIEEAVCQIRDPRAEYVRSLADATGMLAKRTLAPGDLLRVTFVEGRDLVKNGDMIRLVAQINDIRVSTQARALQRGKLGDCIRVRNLDSGQALKAVVTGPGAVRVMR
jgi:flagella basal body P-ring formation protein FlgA